MYSTLCVIYNTQCCITHTVCYTTLCVLYAYIIHTVCYTSNTNNVLLYAMRKQYYTKRQLLTFKVHAQFIIARVVYLYRSNSPIA